MNTKIDSGRKYPTKNVGIDSKWWNLHYAGEPHLVLDAWHGSNGWVINAQPTSYGSYAGGGVNHNLAVAIVPAIKFLIEHGESKDLIVSSIFPEERAAIADALFGWL